MATGVYKTYKKDGSVYYRVSITYKNKHISIASYDDEALAAKAYTIAYDILTGKSDKSKNTWIKQKYYGIDSSNINKVLSPEWWKKIEYDDFDSMTSDGRYLDITIQNTDKTVLDLGIENCKNNEILEVLKYHKEKEDILKYRRQ